MIKVDAYLYDGRLSKKTEVKLVLFSPDTIRILGLAKERTYKISEVKISHRIGNAPRVLTFPDDSKCEVSDNDAIDEFLSAGGEKSFQGFVYKLESRFLYAVAALVLTALILLAALAYGVPSLARRAAFLLPPAVNASLGDEGLGLLDKTLFSPSEISKEKMEIYSKGFLSITRDLDGFPNMRLEFRKSALLGANALALPSGIIVVTDALIELSEDDNEVIAVIAHEAGHVEGRHSLRMLLQASTVALIVSSITGDVTSITALSATIPTVLIKAKYSREFEEEADDYAYRYMKEARIPGLHFVNILERIAKATGGEGGGGYLSTHPATEERALKFKE